MDYIFLIGRILFGGVFIFYGINHFRGVDMMSGYAASKGVPSPKLAVLGSGLLLIIGGLSVLTGYQPAIGVAALVLFLVPVTLVMHAFWKIDDPQAKMAEAVNFMKNTGLLGGALMLLAIPQPWPFSLGGLF